jgi:hypothetical protein
VALLFNTLPYLDDLGHALFSLPVFIFNTSLVDFDAPDSKDTFFWRQEAGIGGRVGEEEPAYCHSQSSLGSWDEEANQNNIEVTRVSSPVIIMSLVKTLNPLPKQAALTVGVPFPWCKVKCLIVGR